MSNWKERHNEALIAPRGPEIPAVRLWGTVRDMHTTLKDDGFGAPNVVAPLLSAMRAYLNYDMGRLDAGTFDKAIMRMAKQAGLNPDEI